MSVAADDPLDRELQDRLAAPGASSFFRVAAALMVPPSGVESIARYEVEAPHEDDPSLQAATEFLRDVTRVLAKLSEYGIEKADDRFGRQLEALTFDTFHHAREDWSRLTGRFAAAAADRDALEWRLLARILTTWSRVFEREQYEELLRDFSELLADLHDQEALPVLNARDAAARLARMEQLTSLVLRNLLIRLALFCEPRRAAVVYRTVGSVGSVAHWIDVTTPRKPMLAEGADAAWPPWLDSSWADESVLSRLAEDMIENAVRNDSVHRVITISDGARGEGLLGFVLLEWPAETEACHEFDAARPLWMASLRAFLLERDITRERVMSGRVYSMIAHNLGSPIFQLSSDARVLVDGYLEGDPARRQQKYEQILRQSRYIRGIIDAILSIDDRKVELDLREIPLAEIVYEAVRAVRVEAHGYVHIDYPRPTEDALSRTRFYTDETRVYDVVLNLLSNAVKYSPDTGVVHVAVAVSNHGAEITVADEGPGVPDSERLEIFKPFFRGRWAAENRVAGLGLGLYVADLYTRTLGGRVNVSSGSRGGAVFRVHLPPFPRQGEL